MDLRPVTFWNYFSSQSGTYRDGSQFTKVTIRALTPIRRKIVDRSSIVLGALFAALLVIGVFPPVLDGINHPLALLIIPIFGGGFYILTTALLILFLRKEKAGRGTCQRNASTTERQEKKQSLLQIRQAINH